MVSSIINEFTEFIDEISPRSTFTRDELLKYFKRKNFKLNPNTFGSRINMLKRKNLIRQIKHGEYSIQVHSQFEPILNNKLLRIYRLINSEYGWLNFCVWNTNWLNEFMIHQPVINYTIVEIDEGIHESIFNYLKSHRLRNLYLSPYNDLINDYILDEKEVIIVRSLFTRSPIRNHKNVKIPYLEKILVDIFCDKQLFKVYQGTELNNIFYYSFKNYNVDYSKLINYAKRHGKGNQIVYFLSTLKLDYK